jgi:hypothetical protein
VGFESGLCGKEQAMDAREANGRQQLGGDDAITTRIGALALALAIPVLVVAEYFHPSKEDPMDNHAVFMEYAHSDIWTTVHLGEYFAAAEAVRWTEIAMNSFSFFLAGLTLFLFGLAIALGRVYPRWVGVIAAVSGAAFMYDGAVVVAYEGFVPSIIKLVGLLLLAVWAFIMAFLMWRNGGRRRITRLGPTPPGAAPRPASTS